MDTKQYADEAIKFVKKNARSISSAVNVMSLKHKKTKKEFF